MKTIFNTLTQKLVNKINARNNFTYLKQGREQKNYIVSVKNIYTGKNPSLFFNMNIDLKLVLNNDVYDSIGLWQNDKDGIYYVDANVHFFTLKTALSVAQKYDQIAIYDIKNNKTINL